MIIEITNALPQNVDAQNNVLFTSNKVMTKNCGTCCGGITHELGSGVVELNATGIYKVTFSANITSATAGAVSLILQSNGEPISASQMDYTVATANAYGNVAKSTLVRVCKTSKTITVENNSALATLVKDASLIVEKVV